MAKLKITQTNSVTNTVVDAYVSPTLVGGNHIGSTGGLTSQAGYQLQPTVKVGTNGATTGSILAQKGAHKFRVTDGTNQGDCTLVNQATPTAANTMTLAVNLATATSANLTEYTGLSVTTAYVTYGVSNLSAYKTISSGDVLTGTGLTGTVTVTNVAVAAGVANVTVSFASQVVSNIAGTGTFSSTVYASRVSNKFVWDFGNDGQAISTSGTNTYYTSGYNPNKYRYHCTAPTATFVQVATA